MLQDKPSEYDAKPIHSLLINSNTLKQSKMTTTTKPGEQMVAEQLRNKVFADIRHLNENNICLDCEKKNPKWASIYLGIHLCIDCAGKHRQYGVIYSFVKSTNLDAWNQRQILFMQKGGNSRALQFFRKRGVITNTNRHIDYKSAVVQQYKSTLTDEVELELNGGLPKKVVPTVEAKTQNKDDFFNLNPKVLARGKVEEKKEIPKAEEVEEAGEKAKKGKKKSKGANRITNIDFDNLVVDDGVPQEEKDKIIKEYEKSKDLPHTSSEIPVVESASSLMGTPYHHVPEQPKIEEPKELSEEEAKKKMEELKLQTNLKNISSQSFKDTSIDNVVLKQNLYKFSGSSSISSSAFFNKEEESNATQETIDKLKDMVSKSGEVLYSKLSGISGLWKKK